MRINCGDLQSTTAYVYVSSDQLHPPITTDRQCAFIDDIARSQPHVTWEERNYAKSAAVCCDEPAPIHASNDPIVQINDVVRHTPYAAAGGTVIQLPADGAKHRSGIGEIASIGSFKRQT